MVDNLSYSGSVTVKTVSKNGVTFSSHRMNSGTTKLFLLFAKALANYDVGNLLPKYLDITDGDGVSLTTSSGIVPNISFNEEVDSSGNYTPYGSPFTRISATMFHNMFQSNVTSAESMKMVLMCGRGQEDILASVELTDAVMNSIKNLSSGTQFIVVWDLYVKNKEDA